MSRTARSLIVIMVLLLIAAVAVGVCYSQGVFDSLIPDENPGTDEPGTDTPGTDEPGTDEPGTDEPGTDTPGGNIDKPGTDTPGGNTDEPDKDEPSGEPGEEDIIAEDIKVTFSSAGKYTIDESGIYHFSDANTDYAFDITPLSSKGEVTNYNFQVSFEVFGSVVLQNESSGRPIGDPDVYATTVNYGEIITSICCMDELFYGKSLEELKADPTFGSMFSAYSTLEEAHQFIYQSEAADKHMKNIGSYSDNRILITTGGVKLSDYYKGWSDRDGGYKDLVYQSQAEPCYIQATITESVSGTKVILKYVFN